jgi:adenylate kinase
MAIGLAKVIVVTGTPGTGKTKFSKTLAKEVGAAYLPLTEYVTKNRLYLGIDRRRASKIIDLNRTRKNIRGLLARSPGLVVIDTHVPVGVVDRRAVKQVFVLRCHPRILKKRLRAKGWNHRKIQENLLAEILDICFASSIDYYGVRRVAQLDTSKINLKSNVALAKRILMNSTPKRKTSLDWIRQLEKEGSLEEYIR